MTPEHIHAFVAAYPRVTCAEIAAALDVLPAVVSALLRKLKLAGKIKRVGTKQTRGSRWRAA